MNIAIIGSGGDGAGMNQCLYELCKRLKKHNVMLFYRGYQGIIDNRRAIGRHCANRIIVVYAHHQNRKCKNCI